MDISQWNPFVQLIYADKVIETNERQRHITEGTTLNRTSITEQSITF
jgi:hypothetical protein